MHYAWCNWNERQDFLIAAANQIKKDPHPVGKLVLKESELLQVKQAITICIARGAAQMIRKGQRLASRR
jgi:hypothetical protein